MLIMDFDDFLYSSIFFSLLFDLPPNCRGTPADPSLHTNVPHAGCKSLV
jgi:hypothetical protein